MTDVGMVARELHHRCGLGDSVGADWRALIDVDVIIVRANGIQERPILARGGYRGAPT